MQSDLRPLSEAFRDGSIFLQGEEASAVGAANGAEWLAVDVNSILTVAAVISFLLLMRSIADLSSSILSCLIRWRANVNLEHSVSMSRRRNMVALACVLFFCLAADRFGAYSPEFMDTLAPGWRVPVLVGITLAYQLLRKLLHIGLHPPRMDSETRRAVQSCVPNYFIALCWLLIPLLGLDLLLGVRDIVGRMGIWAASASFFLVAMVRKAQILSSSCSFLRTFLYLCGLEFFPMALVILSGAVL